MTQNVLIGIGGTGAKCIEAFLHLCAAGLGPDQCHVGLIDQDSANGNVARTRQLLKGYEDLRGMLRGNRGNHLLGDPEAHLFHTHIGRLGANGLWTPVEKMGSTLEDISGYHGMPQVGRHLMELLFHPQQEMKLQMDEGFHARPAVGAAALLTAIEGSTHSFWTDIHNLLDVLRGGESVRLFLIGSVFGGTGASGFPNLAHYFRRKMHQQGHNHHAFMGGSLLLPYFRFPDARTGSENNENGIRVSADLFLEQSHGALLHYGQQFANLGLHRLHLIGWETPINMGYYKRGGQEQTNPAMLPEMYASMGALSFFSDTLNKRDEQPIRYTALPSTITWDSLPAIPSTRATSDGEREHLRDQMSTLLRFCLAIHYVYAPTLLTEIRPKSGRQGKDGLQHIRNEAWFTRLITNMGLETGSIRPVLEAMDDYAIRALLWMAEQIFTSSSDAQPVTLLPVDLYAAKKSDRETGNLAELRSFVGMPPPSLERMRPPSQEKAKGWSELFLDLTYERPHQDDAGLGGLFSVLYKSCRL